MDDDDGEDKVVDWCVFDLLLMLGEMICSDDDVTETGGDGFDDDGDGDGDRDEEEIEKPESGND